MNVYGWLMNARLPSPLFLAVCHIAVTEVAVQAQANYVLLAETLAVQSRVDPRGGHGCMPPANYLARAHAGLGSKIKCQRNTHWASANEIDWIGRPGLLSQ